MNLFTIHNVAASGGSICSQFVAACSNSLLVSEIAPSGWLLHPHPDNRQYLHGFKPGRPLDHALLNSGKDLSPELKLKYFGYQLEITLLHAHELGKNVLLREHNHSTFPFHDQATRAELLPFLSSWLNSVSLNIPLKQWRPILTVRHPLDSFLSAREKGWHEEYLQNGTNTFDSYCLGLLRMQQSFADQHKALVLRYEDLCSDSGSFLSHLSDGLGCSFFTQPTSSDISSVAVTGKSGRQSPHICLRERQIRLIDDNLTAQIETSAVYMQLCALNGYSPEIQALKFA